jgi:hypothetical protein
MVSSLVDDPRPGTGVTHAEAHSAANAAGNRTTAYAIFFISPSESVQNIETGSDLTNHPVLTHSPPHELPLFQALEEGGSGLGLASFLHPFLQQGEEVLHLNDG